MEVLFIKILNMSLTACWMISAAILLRLILKKSPKNIRFLLWALVGIRLVCPISVESMFSMVPTSEPIPNEFISTEIPNFSNTISQITVNIDKIANSTISNEPLVQQTAAPEISVISVLSIIWLAGIATMAFYAFFSYYKIHRKVRASLETEKNVYICDDIDSPFILGIFRPKIYLPSDLSAEESACVLAHERSHIKRLDYIWKPLGFAILSVYWFNPMIWVAYILLCRDIELACDEKVIKKMDVNEKRIYSQALLSCSISKRTVSACPLAFGEVGVKNRVKSILNYRKPVFWVMIVSVIICIVAGILFITDPKQNKELDLPTNGESVTFTCDDPGSKTSVISPSITLFPEENSFSFTYSAWSSYANIGNYRISDGKLILETNDGSYHYVFDIISKNQIAFNESESSELPDYRVSGDSDETEKPITNGAIFQSDYQTEPADETEINSEGSVNVGISADSYWLFVTDGDGNSSITKPFLTLDSKTKRFTLGYGILSSIGVTGTYKKTDTKLICISDDGKYKYIFNIMYDGYLFSREIPFEHPQYKEDTMMEPLVDGDNMKGETFYYSYNNGSTQFSLSNECSKYLLITDGKGYSGDCSLTDDTLTCFGENNKELFIFDRVSQYYVFNKEWSAAECNIPDGAVFTLRIHQSDDGTETLALPSYPYGTLYYYEQANEDTAGSRNSAPLGARHFTLSENGTCYFTPKHPGTFEAGTFTLSENRIIISTNNGKTYLFDRVSANEFSFNANGSSAETPIKDGTVFKTYGDNERVLEDISMYNG